MTADRPALTRRFPAYPDHFTYEPSRRWVRGRVGDVTVVDSRDQLLVWEPGHKVPEYGFPRAHVRTDLLEPGAPPTLPYWRPQTPDVAWFDLVLPGRRVPAAAWRWDVAGLEDHLALSWHPGILDQWLEEDEPVITHPRDPGNRVDVVPSSRHVVVRSGERVLAESRRPLALFENRLPTRWYLPREDVRWDALVPVGVTSSCPYKGVSDHYWATTEEPGREVAWSYSAPFHQVAAIRDRVAFYDERVEVLVDGVPSL